MEPLSAFMFGLILTVNMVIPSVATDYIVGDSAGWTMGADYSTWTSDKTFVVGDNLVFNYGGGHTVDEVADSDYNTCTVGNSISTDSSGATTISLKTPGTHYFICGIPGHCGSGMKLAVNVKAAAAGGSTAPTGTTTPSSDKGLPSGTNANTNPTTTTTKTPSTMSNYSAGLTLSPAIAMSVGFMSLCLLAMF